MEDAFNQMQRDKKNTVDNLVKWMQDAKVIDSAKASEDEARKLFEGADQANVELSKFKEVITALATKQNKTLAEYTKLLGDQGTQLISTLQAGASALKDALKF